MLHGLLNLNKPAGPTSRQVVDLVQRLARPAKVGHAGTLDPLAGGVLVVCVGAATRLIEYVQRMPKRYTGTFLLGRQSPTEDVQGQVTLLESPPVPTRERVLAAAGALVGCIQQRPPAFSALKVEGRRAYDLARQGRPVALAPRPVTVYDLAVLRYEYPEMVLEIECSGGTYVRSLGRDLAASLGTAAVMSALVRTAIGPFRIQEALDPDGLSRENLAGELLPMLRAVETLPQMVLSADELARIRNGLAIRRPEGTVPIFGHRPGTVAQHGSASARKWDCPPSSFGETGEIAALSGRQQLVAILQAQGPGLFRPVRNFVVDRG